MDIVTDNSQEAGTGAKRTGVLLVHGLTGTPVEMKPLEKHLRKLGFDVENVLLAGHGGSHQEMISSKWTDWMDSVRQAMHRILLRNDRVIICGLSMGALIGAGLAAEESRVSALVMLSPTLYYDGIMNNGVMSSALARDVMRAVINVMPAIGSKAYWEESPPYGIRDERIQKQITKSIEAARAGGNNEFGVFRTYFVSFTQMWDLVDHVRACFAKVKCPVLMMHSLDDTLVSVHNATETYLKVASDNKALFMLTGCDHVMTLDLQRTLVHSMIGLFVQQFSQFNTEFKTVRSVIAPALEGAKIAKGGNISAIISPEMHGLSREEWKAIYPGRRYAHLASVSDVHQLHSIVLRDKAQPVMGLPVFVGDYGQIALFKNSSRIWNLMSRLIVKPNATVFGLGSLIAELPGLGLNSGAAEESRSRALSHLAVIVESMARTAAADAFTNVQHTTPPLPEPAVLERAVDKKPVRLDERILKLLSGTETFCHRKALQGAFARFIQITVPPAPSNTREQVLLEEAAVSAG
jgi:carboxylesterase